jgi:MAF protein
VVSRRLVLASTSPWRGDLMRRLGLPFEQMDPDLDEAPHHAEGMAPRVLVMKLAEAKARALASKMPDALILGADQVVCIDGDVLGKPGSPERAFDQLRRLAGRTHELITGTALLDARTGSVHGRVCVHRMTMRRLSDEALRDYIRRDDPVACAGSYKVESLGVALFETMIGDDWTSIVGLPLTVVVGLLDAAGVRVLG